MEMNRAQQTIARYVKRYHPGATWAPTAPAAVTVTTEDGNVMTLGINLYGDIMRDDKIIARGNTDHSFDGAGYIMPTDWMIL